MAVKILPAQIRNLQQIEAVVAGPDDANRLFIIDGQFDCQINAFSWELLVNPKKKPLLSWPGQSSLGNSSLKQMGQLHLQRLVLTLQPRPGRS